MLDDQIPPPNGNPNLRSRRAIMFGTIGEGNSAVLATTSLDELEPRLRTILGLVDRSEQTRRVLDFVIAYAINVSKGAVQVREHTTASARSVTETGAPRTRVLAVLERTAGHRRTLDFVIGYAASVGPIEALILDIRPGTPLEPTHGQGAGNNQLIDNIDAATLKSAARRLAHVGILHETRVEYGDPAEAIIRCACEEGCDMIVLNDPDPGIAAGELPRGLSISGGSLSQRVANMVEIPVVIAK